MSNTTPCRDCGRVPKRIVTEGDTDKPCCQRARCPFCAGRHEILKHPPRELHFVTIGMNGRPMRGRRKPYYHRLWFFGRFLQEIEKAVCA